MGRKVHENILINYLMGRKVVESILTSYSICRKVVESILTTCSTGRKVAEGILTSYSTSYRLPFRFFACFDDESRVITSSGSFSKAISNNSLGSLEIQ